MVKNFYILKLNLHQTPEIYLNKGNFLWHLPHYNGVYKTESGYYNALITSYNKCIIHDDFFAKN